jgi:hypothetical protein
MRQLDLVRAAISPPGVQRPLRGRRSTIEDLERSSSESSGGQPTESAAG